MQKIAEEISDDLVGSQRLNLRDEDTRYIRHTMYKLVKSERCAIQSVQTEPPLFLPDRTITFDDFIMTPSSGLYRFRMAPVTLRADFICSNKAFLRIRHVRN